MTKKLFLSVLFLMTVFGTVKTLQWITSDSAADRPVTITKENSPLRSSNNQPLGVLNPGGTLDHAKLAACKANLANLNNYIIQYRTQYPGKAVTMAALKKAGIILPQCQNGGQYVLKNGVFVCTIHSVPQK